MEKEFCWGEQENKERSPLLSYTSQGFSLPPQLDGSRHRARQLLTYEGLFVFHSPQVVAAWEEGVSISLVKPWQIPEIET